MAVEGFGRMKAGSEGPAARQMQLWCIELSNLWLKTWHPVGMTELAMHGITDMWSGGDVPEALKMSLPRSDTAKSMRDRDR